MDVRLEIAKRATEEDPSTLIFPPPPGTHFDCDICNGHYYSIEAQRQGVLSGPDVLRSLYKGFYRDEDAQTTIYNLDKWVTASLDYVKDVLKSHGDLILKRWTKKSRDKRGMLLKSAAYTCFGDWPPYTERKFVEDLQTLGRPPSNYVDLMSYPMSVSALFGSGFISDWIDIEDFAEDRMKLLSLLNVRTVHSARDWAPFDARECSRYFAIPQTPLLFNAKCVLMTGEDYGRLVDFDVDLIHSGAALGFPRAYATLWAQTFMARGLRDIVDDIVAGASPSGDLEWAKLASDGFHSSASDARWGIYDNQGLAPPSSFDPELLTEMARDQLNRTVDELELLQTDPDYMYGYLMNMKANISWNMSVSPSCKWTYIAGVITALWTDRLFRWQTIVDKSQELTMLSRKHWSAIESRRGLPETVKAKLANYGILIRDMLETEMVQLELATCDMHALKETWTKHEKAGKLHHRDSYSEDFAKQGDRIVFLVKHLKVSEPAHRTGTMRGALENLSAELAKVRPDERVDETFSAIAILDAMSLIWRSAYTILPGEPRSSQARAAMALERMKAIRSQLNLAGMRSNEKRFHHLGSLLRKFCDFPGPKNRKSSDWLDRKTETRNMLARFWQSVREDWQQSQTDSDGSVVDAVVGYLSADMSARHLAEVREERASLEAELRRSQEAKTRKKENTHDLQSVWGVEPEPSKLVRTKAKTIRIPTANEPDIARLELNDDILADDLAGATQQTIAVKADSKSIFDRIFSRTATASSFRWSHLVKALIDAGMVATQSAGSAVRFRNGQGSICFHHPHGNNHDSTLSAGFLRNQIGKRLTKWFAWDSDTFVERGKDE